MQIGCKPIKHKIHSICSKRIGKGRYTKCCFCEPHEGCDAKLVKTKKPDHEDTTFTLSKDRIYLYQGFKPVRTFKEVL